MHTLRTKLDHRCPVCQVGPYMPCLRPHQDEGEVLEFEFNKVLNELREHNPENMNVLLYDLGKAVYNILNRPLPAEKD